MPNAARAANAFLFFIEVLEVPVRLAASSRALRPRPSLPSHGAAGRAAPRSTTADAESAGRAGPAVRGAARGARPAGRGAVGRASPSASTAWSVTMEGSGRFPLREPH